MTLSLTQSDLIQITGGSSLGAVATPVFQGVEFDSREIRGGELFVALAGEKTHGHQFLATAFNRGAALALVESEQIAKDSEFPTACVIVPNSLLAFQQLASYWRAQLTMPVIGVTGSVGKTTVKEMLASILMLTGAGTYSLKSHNNHVGVPYTICRIKREHAWAVIEMGMNHAGEISTVSKIARPDVGVITTIAPAHIEHLGSLDAIADAKCEILHGMSSSSTLVVNGDSQALEMALNRAEIRSTQRVIRFGAEASGLDATLVKAESRGLEGLTLTARLGSQEITASMSVLGRHNALNALAAVVAAQAACPDMELLQLQKGLENFKAPLMRLNRITLANGRILVDDSYNANPASMKALIELATDLQGQGSKVGLVLGDMFELGPDSERYHTEIGQAVAACRPVFLVCVGPFSRFYLTPAQASGIATYQAETPEQAGHVAAKLQSDILLVKASRGMQLDRAVSVLRSDS